MNIIAYAYLDIAFVQVHVQVTDIYMYHVLLLCVIQGHDVVENAPLNTVLGSLIATGPDTSPDRMWLNVTSDGDLVRLVATPNGEYIVNHG